MIEALQRFMYWGGREQPVFWDITNYASEQISKNVQGAAEHLVTWRVMYRIPDRYLMKELLLTGWRIAPSLDYAVDHVLNGLQDG